jgi:glycosyltransferase involved in cell wall biosynthesis
MQDALLSVVVPTHDEASTVVGTVAALRATEWPVPIEIVVVDDGSKDGTVAALGGLVESGAIRLISHPARLGRGAAVRSGVGAAAGEIIAIHDGDGEYSAEDLRYAVSFVLEGRADAVFGSRILGPGRSVVQYWRARAVTLLSNAFTNLNLSDATTSCVVIRSDVWHRLRLTADGFDFDVELIAALAQSGARIWEVPISYSYRYRGDGRKSRRRHTVRRMWRVIKSWLRRGTLLREGQQ